MMTTPGHPARSVADGPARAAACCCSMLTLAGCTGAPAVNVVGSYFPAWMLCALIGITAAACLRQLLVLAGLEGKLVLPLLTHVAVALAATMAVWLVWFGH